MTYSLYWFTPCPPLLSPTSSTARLHCATPSPALPLSTHHHILSAAPPLRNTPHSNGSDQLNLPPTRRGAAPPAAAPTQLNSTVRLPIFGRKKEREGEREHDSLRTLSTAVVAPASSSHPYSSLSPSCSHCCFADRGFSIVRPRTHHHY